MSYLNVDPTTKFQVTGSIIFIYLSNKEYSQGGAEIINFLIQEEIKLDIAIDIVPDEPKA